jgi:ABC-type phosphate/phosphonate transport system substrate-binding protein
MAPMVASFPMYDWPEVQWAQDALWTAVAERLRERGLAAPDRLDRVRALDEVWLDPDLVLSQTCGYPLSTRLRGKVQLVATPVHTADGCKGCYYSSAVIARRRDGGAGLESLAGRRVAFNSQDSLSGYVTLRAAMRQAGVDPDAARWIETGSHRASVRAVASGEADLAGIDAVCWALAGDHEAEAVSRLVVFASTPLRPALPWITAKDRPPRETAAIRAALTDALASTELMAAPEALHLAGAAFVGDSEYLPLADLQ